MRATLIGQLALFGSGPALAQDTVGDPEAGRQVVGICQNCHGLDGDEGGLRTPRIGGQPAAYLVEQLRAYRSGERENYIMSDIAKDLTDEQIEDVAAWYASHTATPVLPEGFSTAAAPDQCFGWRGANGIARRQDAPNLVGDKQTYLEAQMEAFRSGVRQSEVMTPIAQRLSDEELAEVADWYFSIGLEVSGPQVHHSPAQPDDAGGGEHQGGRNEVAAAGAAYKRRNVIERIWGRLKNWRRVAARYDRLARNDLAGLALVAAVAAWT